MREARRPAARTPAYETLLGLPMEGLRADEARLALRVVRARLDGLRDGLQYTRPAAPHHLHDVELAPDGGTLLDDSAHIRRRSFSHSDITRLSPPRPTAAERASSDGAAMRGSKSSGQLTRV
jgi:hypothetical protein